VAARRAEGRTTVRPPPDAGLLWDLRSCSSAVVLAAWRDWCSGNRLPSWRCRTRREAGSAGVL